MKRVAQELGGKSANIILDDANLEEAVGRDAFGMCMNSGQSCNAATRMLVPQQPDGRGSRHRWRVDGCAPPSATPPAMPPPLGGGGGAQSSPKPQWNKIQGLIQKGIDEGATLVCGGLGRPDGLDEGYYVKPTVFADVTNDMTIAREEIFGPVLVIIGYEDDDDAVRIANDTPYGLSGYVSGSHDRAVDIAPAHPYRQHACQRSRARLQRTLRGLQAVWQRSRVGAPTASRTSSRPRQSWAANA